MQKKHFILFLILVSFVPINTALSQGKGYKVQKNNKKKYEAYPNPYDFRPNGWMFEAAATITSSLETSHEVHIGDSTFSFGPSPRPGIALNIGRYHSIKKWHKIVKYVDYNLGYKFLWNSESHNLSIPSKDTLIEFSNHNYAHYVSLNLNLNNIYSFSDYLFLQNTLGINADYRFVSSNNGGSSNTINEPSTFIVQLHYKLGLGFIIDNDKAIIPYIEIPVLNITPQQTNFSQLDYFSGSYQTFLVGVRVMLFRLGQKDCPKAIGTEGKVRTNGY